MEFPIRALSDDEVAGFRGEYERLEPLLGGPPPAPQHGQSHLHFHWAHALATRPAILDLVESLVGPDILIHSSTLFCKRPHDRAFVSWHQDGYTWGLSEPLLVTAWIAITDSSAENGCMRAIPGTHRRRLSHAERRHKDNLLRITGLAVDDAIDEDRAVDVVLRAGELSLHHPDLVHGSSPNRSPDSRLGFVVRYVSPAVRQDRRHHQVVLARGADAYGNYELVDPPRPASPAEGLAAHAAFWREPRRNAR